MWPCLSPHEALLAEGLAGPISDKADGVFPFNHLSFNRQRKLCSALLYSCYFTALCFQIKESVIFLTCKMSFPLTLSHLIWVGGLHLLGLNYSLTLVNLLASLSYSPPSPEIVVLYPICHPYCKPHIFIWRLHFVSAAKCPNLSLSPLLSPALSLSLSSFHSLKLFCLEFLSPKYTVAWPISFSVSVDSSNFIFRAHTCAENTWDFLFIEYLRLKCWSCASWSMPLSFT